MAKYFGRIGYYDIENNVPGVWSPIMIEREYYGDIVKTFRKLDNANVNNDSTVSENQISIVADAFAYDNFMNIRYICWMGSKWKVSRVEISRPRLIFTLGGLYNDETGASVDV